MHLSSRQGFLADIGSGGRTEDALILSERGSLFTQATLDVDLGQNVGSRSVLFDVNALFDLSDGDGLGDRLLVYLVDPANPSQTLWIKAYLEHLYLNSMKMARISKRG